MDNNTVMRFNISGNHVIGQELGMTQGYQGAEIFISKSNGWRGFAIAVDIQGPVWVARIANVENTLKWEGISLKDDLVVTYGGVLSGTVDFASADLFGSSGSIMIWETENVTTPTYAPEYYSYGVLVCTRTTHLYKQELISGSINGAKYEKLALTLTGLKTANWYKYTGTVANQAS